MERANKSAAALMLWSALVVAALHFTWPAATLPVEEIPALPGVEQCGFDKFENCFAKAVTQRQWIFTRRNEFAESYPERTHNHLLIGAIVWVAPVALFFAVRQYRQGHGKSRKEKRNVV